MWHLCVRRLTQQYYKSTTNGNDDERCHRRNYIFLLGYLMNDRVEHVTSVLQWLHPSILYACHKWRRQRIDATDRTLLFVRIPEIIETIWNEVHWQVFDEMFPGHRVHNCIINIHSIRIITTRNLSDTLLIIINRQVFSQTSVRPIRFEWISTNLWFLT